MKSAIIGGGAAGLYLAALYPSATIIEKNAECGRKLLLTGGGRCNFTHEGTPEDLLPHYNGSRQFIRKVLYGHAPEDIAARFRALGVESVCEDGRLFPAGEDAHIIRDALLRRAGDIISGNAVSVSWDGSIFRIALDGGRTLAADTVVIAAGGSHYPQTGSDGSGTRLLAALGHRITPIRPALAPLRLERKLTPAMGISLEGEIRAGRRACRGSLLITHDGISGPAVLDLSRWIGDGDEVSIRFADAGIRKLRASSPKKEARNALPVPPRLADALLGPLSRKNLGNFSRADEMAAERSITSFTSRAWPIASAAMSTCGGADTSQFDPATMESRLVPGLFAIGDVLDVDGNTGGYSLTFAFASAYAAYRAIAGSR